MKRSHNDRRDWYRSRIAERQRKATQLSIQLKLDAQERDDVAALAETADILEIAVEELERAHRTLSRA